MAPKPKKPSTSYSPWSMGAKEAGEMYGRARDKQTKYLTAKEIAKKSSYSPAPMSAAAKKAAANRGVLRNSLSGLKQTNLDKKAKTKPTPRKALKRPTGELSKSNSKLAKFIKGSASGKNFTAAETRTAAGKYREMEKAAGGFRALDSSGVALGKAEAAVKKMGKPKSKTKASLKNQVANARKAAAPKNVASAANNINISDYKVQGTRTAMRNRMQLDRSRTASRAKNVASRLAKAKKK